jgi:ferric iron reductase protein FhuF
VGAYRQGVLVVTDSDLATILAPYSPVLGPHRERLTVSTLTDDADLVPAIAYLTPGTLLAAIEQVRARFGAPDPRVAASLWNKHYNAAVIPGILAAMTLTGIGLNAAITNVTIVLRDGLPMGSRLHHLADTAIYPPRFPSTISNPFGRLVHNIPDLHNMVLTNLLQENLQLIIDRLSHLTRISKNILWDNAGNLCADLYERIAGCSNGHAVLEDRRALLETPEIASVGLRNPLYQSVRYERLVGSGVPSAIRVRRSCCLRYRLGEQEPCYVCPLLTPSERIAAMKQRATV